MNVVSVFLVEIGEKSVYVVASDVREAMHEAVAYLGKGKPKDVNKIERIMADVIIREKFTGEKDAV